MIRIVVVDDETTSLRAMGRFVSHIRKDVEVLGLFENMKDTIAFLRENHVDIVMTDIKMPGGNGIELARFIQENYPEAKIVFFSAYRDFEYAQQAISLNVKHYLSKPIDTSELSDMLDKLVRMIRDEQKAKMLEKSQSRKYNELLLLAKTNLYADILAGFLSDKKEIKQRAESIELTEDEREACYGVVTVRCERITAFPNGRNEYYHMLSNLMRELKCLDDFITIIKQESQVTMVVRFKPKLSLEMAKAHLNYDCEQARKNTAETLSVQMFFEIAYICQSVYNLCYYKEMANNSQLFRMKYQEMSSAVFSDDAEKVKEIFDSLACYARTLEINHAKKLFYELFVSLEKNFVLSGMEKGRIFNYDELWQQYDISELIEFSQQQVFKLQKLQALSVKGIEALTIQKAKEYIHENYMNDIMLEDIANHVNLSSFYLSKFFKSKTGVTLTDYIISVRMKAAIELYKTRRYKIYEISEMCGYKSRKYFSHAFKQYTGYTPSEYQRILN